MKRPLPISLLLVIALAGGANAFNPFKKAGPEARYELAKYPGTEQTAQIEGIRTVFLDEGNGDPILFIHGLAGDLSDWSDQVIYFKQHYRVLALDLPGHGKSEKRNDIPYGRELFTKVVSEFLKQRGADKAVVVGNSMGGLIAASLALAHPEQVKMLVLCDAAGVNPYPSPMAAFLNWASPDIVQRTWMNPRTMKKNGPKSFAYPENYPGRRLDEDIALTMQPDAKQYAYAVVKSLQDTMKQDLRKYLKEIKCPTFIIWGDMDSVIEPRHAYIWQDGIADSILVKIPDAGHIPMVETPDLFNKAVEIFIHGYADNRLFKN